MRVCGQCQCRDGHYALEREFELVQGDDGIAYYLEMTPVVVQSNAPELVIGANACTFQFLLSDFEELQTLTGVFSRLSSLIAMRL